MTKEELQLISALLMTGKWELTAQDSVKVVNIINRVQEEMQKEDKKVEPKK